MENIYEFITNLINSTGSVGIIFNCLLIVIESIIPPLPLAVFITVLFLNYGPLLGFLISWIFTIVGCIISFYLFQSLFKQFVDKYMRKKEKTNKFINIIDNISFSNLVLILSIPFTPAFLVNIAAGISKIEFKKFLIAIIIGKIPLVIFWGFIGTSLIESLRNPINLMIVIILLLITYIISKFVNKKLNLN